MKRALSYPLKLIAKNAGVNGSVVSEKVSGYFTICINCYEEFIPLRINWVYVFRCCQVTTQNTDTMLRPDSMKISWLQELLTRLR